MVMMVMICGIVILLLLLLLLDLLAIFSPFDKAYVCGPLFIFHSVQVLATD